MKSRCFCVFFALLCLAISAQAGKRGKHFKECFEAVKSDACPKMDGEKEARHKAMCELHKNPDPCIEAMKKEGGDKCAKVIKKFQCMKAVRALPEAKEACPAPPEDCSKPPPKGEGKGKMKKCFQLMKEKKLPECEGMGRGGRPKKDDEGKKDE